jgi:hypothetical protein
LLEEKTVRPTLAIDDDVLAVVRILAERERENVGEAVSALARSGLRGNIHSAHVN